MGDDGQLSLFDIRDPRVAAFLAFHRENPHVFELFKRFAFYALERQHRPRFSARTIIHQIRWWTTIETNDPAGFKINNNWSPYYARLLLRDYPEHTGRFELRRSIADQLPDEEES